MKKKKRAAPYSVSEENRLLRAHGYNPKVLHLGTLCKRNHDFQGSGCSVRNRKHGYCHECSSLTQERYSEARKKKQAEYRANNKEKIKEIGRKYREENWEHISAYYREWYAANREQVIQRRKARRQERGDGKKNIHKGGNLK
jgi:hypothetical protein